MKRFEKYRLQVFQMIERGERMKNEIIKIINRKEFYFTTVILFLAVFADYLYECYLFREVTLAGVISAYDGTILSHTAGTPFSVVFELLLPICASVIASTCALEERNKGIDACVITRVKQKKYRLQQGMAIFFVGFSLVGFALLISLFLSLFTFPIQGFHTMSQVDYQKLLDVDRQYLFDYLYRCHPYANMMAFILLRAMFSGLFAWFAYGVSFFGLENKIGVILSPFLFIVFLQLVMQMVKRLGRKINFSEEIWIWFNTNILTINHYGRFRMIAIIGVFLFIIGFIGIRRGYTLEEVK